MDDQRQKTEEGFSETVPLESHHLCLIYDNEQQRREIVSGACAHDSKLGQK